MHTVDLHTHSYGSPDGGLQTADYRHALESGALSYIAITDHNRIDAAQAIQTELGELGVRICIGEEIMTTHGELIGLYLTELVPPGLSPEETVRHIRAQGGLVYVPHPFETVRSGIDMASLDAIVADIDIVETYNGRAVFQDKGNQARTWAEQHSAAIAASSDAHGAIGWGVTYSIVEQMPARDTLVGLLKTAQYQTKRVGFGILYPKLNRIRKLGQ